MKPVLVFLHIWCETPGIFLDYPAEAAVGR
jgi:hypothetical protein